MQLNQTMRKALKQKWRSATWAAAVCLGWAGLPTGAAASEAPTGPMERTVDAFRVTAVWKGEDRSEELKSWTLSELSKLKQTSMREKDPESGRFVRWKGVPLSRLVEQALLGVSVEEKAHFDLIVVHGQGGQQALIPRSFMVKHSVLLATKAGRGDLGTRGPVYSIVPWSSKPKIHNDGVPLPLEKFFVPGVTRLEFANYRDRFGGVYLRRRTDPYAMRGEKLFVRNCVACHATGQGAPVQEVAQRSLASFVGESGVESAGELDGRAASGHPPIRGLKGLSDQDFRSLLTYLRALKEESTVGGSMGTATYGSKSADISPLDR